MHNYLTPILRDQFNKFYRYGYTYIPTSQLLKFDGYVNAETKNNIIDLFNISTPFEFEDDYLILHLDKSREDNSGISRFEIQNIVAIFPLSYQGKSIIETKIDTRINLQEPIFETVLSAIETNIQRTEIEKAIDSLWLICELDGNSSGYLHSISMENLLKGIEFRQQGVKANKIKSANYWSYLIAYDRFDFYPKSTLGYFYDAGQVFAFSKSLPSFDGSGLHKFLQTLHSSNPEIKFLEVISALERDASANSYISQTTSQGIKQYFISPIYLMLKEELRNADDISQTRLSKNLRYLHEMGDNFKFAIVLLGAFFGYKKFYDSYYDKLELRFFKQGKKESKVKKKVENNETDEKIFVVNPDKKTVRVLSNPDSPQLENKQNESEAASQVAPNYRQIIVTTLNSKGECKLSELAMEIKLKTKEKVTNKFVKNVLKEIAGVETFKEKQTEKVRLSSSQQLF